MQIDDRREEWMGLGLLLTEVRFRTWLENREDSKLGVRAKRRVGWRSLFTTGTLTQQTCMERFLSPFGIELKESYHSSEDVFKWLVLMDKLESMYGISHAITDSAGLHMIQWVTDNPLPKKWDDFIVWADSYDAEIEMISPES